MSEWRKDPRPNVWIWETQKGVLRARVWAVRHHATLFCWAVVAAEEDAPFATRETVQLAAGDSLALEWSEALSESQRDAQTALERARACPTCDGRLDTEAQYVNRPGTPCPTCDSSGWVTEISGLPTAVSTTG